MTNRIFQCPVEITLERPSGESRSGFSEKGADTFLVAVKESFKNAGLRVLANGYVPSTIKLIGHFEIDGVPATTVETAAPN